MDLLGDIGAADQLTSTRAENEVLKARVKELEQRCKVLTVENETLKAEVEMYHRSEQGAACAGLGGLGGSTNTTTTTTSAKNNKSQDDDALDDFVKGGDGVYAKSSSTAGTSNGSSSSSSTVLLNQLHGQSNILCCSLSNDDTVLATGGADRSIVLCEWGTAAAASSDSTTDAPAADNVVSNATRIDCGAPVIAIDFARKSIRNKFLASGCMDGTVHVVYYDRHGGGGGGSSSIEAREVAPGSIKHNKYVRQVVWAPNDYVVATASADGSVMIHKLVNWNGIDDEGLAVEKVQSLQLPGPVESMCFSNDYTLCCYARGTSNMMCFDLNDGYTQQKINLNQGPGNAGFDDHVSFAVMDMKPLPETNNYIALATDTSRNIVMDWRSGRQVRNLYGHQNDSFSQPKLAWSKNGQYIYGNTQDDSVVCVWDICSSSIVDKLDGHTNTVRDMFSSSSTDTLVTCSFDKQTFLREDLNTFLKKENHEIPMYLTTWRLRLLAAQKTGLLIRLNCCETPHDQLLFNKRLVAELWTVAKIDASGWEKMSLVQIMSLDDEWLQKKGLWDGTNPLPKTDDEVKDVVRNTNWTKEDVAKALRMAEAGSTHPEIGEELGRTQRSVEAKIGAVKKQLNSTGNS